ncbi:nicotinate-nucleotide--dimethylbenzimidazole phosphoribosyltransferase [mine drainage metagenome]|uniref:Nicotinate-nucleotide--dimethylbenzimidazole phosphoribosyltransferase n=1 Tax=mine drainage metagenome TaxID=410659 RepID=A0A1J5PQ94_9ZZZZ
MSDLDLYAKFSDLETLDLSTGDTAFGKLAPVASWLTATGLAKSENEELKRELILIDEQALASIEDNSIEAAIELGIEKVDRAIDSGSELLIVTSTRTQTHYDLEILVGALTRTDAATVAARHGLDDQTWMEIVVEIRDQIFANRDHLADPIALLANTKSLDVASMLGAILQSANRKTPVVLIGDAAHCAALLATRISHPCREWVMPALDLTSPVGVLTQRHLNRTPILELGMTLENDSTTAIALTTPIIDVVRSLLRS